MPDSRKWGSMFVLENIKRGILNLFKEAINWFIQIIADKQGRGSMKLGASAQEIRGKSMNFRQNAIEWLNE